MILMDWSNTMSIIYIIVIGAAAGWLSNFIVKGEKLRMLANIVIGIIGSVIGNKLSQFLGLGSNGFFGTLPTAIVGAVILLLVINRLKK